MKKTIRHGAVVHCDIPGCDETFTTYSVSSLARKQAADAGFVRLKMGGLPGWEEFGLGSKRSKVLDVCKAHVPRPRMEGSRP